MDGQAVERMLRDGTLRADEIRSFSADQKTLDALGDVGARLWEENKVSSRLFMSRNRDAMGGAAGSVALGILAPNVARRSAGLNELAKKNRFKFDDYYSALGEVREPCAMKDVCHLPPLDPVPVEKLLSCRQALRQAAAGLCCP